MIMHPLNEEAAAVTGATHFADVDYTDLQALAAGNTGTVNLFAVAANVVVNLAFARLMTVFTSSDGAVASLAATVGDGGSATRFLASYELLATPALAKGGALAPNAPNIYAAAGTVSVFFTGTAAHDLNTATAGKLRLFLVVRDARLGGAMGI